MKRRVVVTGLGAVTPVGHNAKQTWEALLAGRSGIAPITHFDASDFDTRIAAEVKDFDLSPFIPAKEVRRMDTFIHFGLAAALMAVEDAGLTVDGSNAERVGVAVGAGLGGLPAIEQYHKVLMERGPRRISPFFIPMVIVNLVPGQISIYTGAKGPNTSVVTACAAGAHCIGDAGMFIERGDAEVMIAGGTEAVITPLAVGGFNAMKALSTRNDEPQQASRPFDIGRDGFVLGEGSGILVLEEAEHAKRRGARIYCELVGYGATGDAYHITGPDPDGDGAMRAMRRALETAGLAPEDIDYINAHGTSTPLNDALETKAIKRAYGDHAHRVAVSSTKSMIGHLLGAAGAVESIICCQAITEGVVPPTINYTDPDPECDLDYVPNEAREMPVQAAMNNSFGFGGTNATLVFRRFEG